MDLDKISVNEFMSICLAKLKEYNSIEKELRPNVVTTQTFTIEIYNSGRIACSSAGAWYDLDQMIPKVDESIKLYKELIEERDEKRS